MTAYAHSGVQLRPQESAILPDLLHASVEFGVLQANGNCTNIGICRINTTHAHEMAATRQKIRRCPVAAAQLGIGPDGRLQAIFPRRGMLPCTERIFFRGPVFPVPVAYCLPDSLLALLPALQQTVIAAGLYPIRRSSAGYFIEF